MRFFFRAISYFRKDWPLIAFFLTLIAISIGIGVMQAWPMAVLVDVVLNQNPVRSSWPERLFLFSLPNDRLAQVLGVAFIGMFMKLAQDCLGAVKIMIANRYTQNGRLRVRCDLYGKLQDLSLSYHRSLPQGDAIYRVLNDTVGCDQILNTLLDSLVAAVTLIVMCAIMFSRNVPLTLFALSVAPLLVITNHYFGKRIKAASVHAKQADTHVTTRVQRAMTSIGLVQAFNRQRREYGQFRTAAHGSSASNYELEKYKALAGFAVQTIYTFGGAIIFGYGGYLVYRDQFLHPKAAGVTCGDLMVFMAYLGSLWDPLQRLTSAKANIQIGVAGAERVFEVLDRPVEVIDSPAAAHLPVYARELSLDEVSFNYLPGKPVLRGISASIAPGQMVAFVGPSGAGKSTLLNLLPRFYDVVGGSLQLDGIDVRQIPLADLRRHVALVPQDSLLLPTTVAENIAYGRPDATLDEIRRAAEMAGAHEFVVDLPDGYDSPLAEGGQNLSGGQRQRIAIARAILSNAPILVLDEPTSALDPQHARHVIDALNHIRRHRTVILVTHHLASVVGCDQIFVLNAGQIVERGTHEELLVMDGVYAEMLRTEPTPDKPNRRRLHEAA